MYSQFPNIEILPFLINLGSWILFIDGYYHQGMQTLEVMKVSLKSLLIKGAG